jgi:short-subunit dehydrogenase
MAPVAKPSLPLYHLLSETEMRNTFTGKTVIITGASTGIGRETALAFAAAGANVVVAARTEVPLRELAAGHPNILAVPADVTHDDDVHRLVAAAIEKFGRIDILVNNAGRGLRANVEQTEFADAQRLMDLNFFAPLRCIQAVLPHMKHQSSGQIVNVGSIVSLLATPRNAIYSASKFAVRALSDALRIELHGTGIDVILIMPGYTDTPFFENQIRYGGPVRVTPIKGQPPAKVAQAILRACRRRQREVVLSIPGKLGAWSKRWCPRLLDRSLIKLRNQT